MSSPETSTELRCLCVFVVVDPLRRALAQYIDEECPVHGSRRWRDPWPPTPVAAISPGGHSTGAE